MIIQFNKIQELIDIIDNKLRESISIDCKYQNKILEAMEYSLFTGGKRIRPLIAISTYESFDDNIDNILPYATAIEMIHTYSLIHDDLPAMDNDDFRRGKLTNHKVFGESMAILAGDGLLNLAFETMLHDILCKQNCEKDYLKKIAAMNKIAKYSGVKGMIGGQVVDLTSSNQDMDKSKLYFMYKSKTAGLFQASVVAGAILGNANQDEINTLTEYALNLGLAYQIQDDFFDTSEDEKMQKPTYLSYYNKEKAGEKIKDLNDQIFKSLEKLNHRNTNNLEQLTKIILNRNESSLK